MDLFEPTVTALLALLLVAVIAGYIDTLVGGGGLITVPALLAVGIPPLYALGTNKLQAVAGSGTASLAMLSRRKVSFKDVRWLMLAAFIGSLLGSVIVQFFDTRALDIAIPTVIVVIAFYFVLAPNHSTTAADPRIGKTSYGLTAVPGIGFYDGMFGPGTGSFLVWAGVALRGQPIVLSTMVAKTLNFATNLASLIVFVSFGKVLWTVGLVMMVGQFIGASLGAKVLMTINPTLLRYLVIAVCFVILVSWVLTKQG